MTQTTSAKNSENDDLTCPITLELFRDPVLAGDGHVYEREAITRWILEHGTSPFTREPLQINDLQSDDHLRRLAARRRRRTSTVSYNARDNIVTLPPLRRVPRATATVAPHQIPNQFRTTSLVGITNRSNKCSYLFICCCVCLCAIPGIIGIGFAIATAVRNSNSSEPGITSTYSNSLTMSSPVFTRPGRSSGSYYYQAIIVTVPVNGYYKFKSTSIIDMYGCLYSSNFDPTNSTTNLLRCDDDTGGNRQFSFQISLQSTNYTLVATTYSSNGIGSFSINVIGPGTVRFQ